MNNQVCVQCVMDNSDPEIIFNDSGICNYCIEASHKLPRYIFTKSQEKKNLSKLKERIISNKKGKYDSILGLSGGVDSSYVAYLAMQMGLNPLCVHFDNGWNSDIAIKNIHKIINKAGFDLVTYVIDWPEFRDLQRSFFKAGVVDIEMLTDHAIFASLYKLKKKYNISTILSGVNYATEHGMSNSWVWIKSDLRQIKAIQKKFGTMKLKSFPTMSTLHWLIIKNLGIGGHFEEPLNHISYKKNEAIKILTNEFDWDYYGGKHYESVFTKFYQAYVLPKKFQIDKRKAHFSDLIRNNEITRDQALIELNSPLYPDTDLIRDKKFVIKKLEFSNAEFEEIMRKKPIAHDHYPTDQSLIKPLVRFLKYLLRK